MARSPSWVRAVTLAAVAVLLATVPLGFLSARTGPVPHAALAIAAGIASIAIHVWRGGGADLGSSLVLGLGVLLGIGVPDGVGLSAWVHLGALRRAAPAAPKPPS